MNAEVPAAEGRVEGRVAEERLAEALISAARHLSDRSLSPGGSGNLSVRSGDGILITPTGCALHRVTVSDLARVPELYATSSVLPSKELPLHEALYRARPDAMAIVHLHSPYATAAACLPPDADGCCPIPVLTPYQRMRFPAIPVAPYAKPGSSALAEALAAAAGRSPAVLLANHGSIVAGTSLDHAVDLAEELEAAARLFFTVHGHDFTTLTAEQQAAL